MSTRGYLVHLTFSELYDAFQCIAFLSVNVKEDLSSFIECLFVGFRNRDVTDSELLKEVSPKVSANDFTDHFTTR